MKKPHRDAPSLTGALLFIALALGACPLGGHTQSAPAPPPGAGGSGKSATAAAAPSTPTQDVADPGHAAHGAKSHDAGIDNTKSGGGKDQVYSAPDARVALAPTPAAPAGDAEAGATVARTGAVDKGAPPCANCHGTNGEGNIATGFPRLAGNEPEYLRKQLDDYASGGRPQAIMTPIARALDEKQRRDVAAYYAAFPPTTIGQHATVASRVAPKLSASSAQAQARARELATLGDANLRVQACANCHGPGGTGLRPAYPALAGQNPAYLISALTEWHDGTRHNDPSGQMPAIAKALSADDIAALAVLYAKLPPPTLSR